MHGPEPGDQRVDEPAERAQSTRVGAATLEGMLVGHQDAGKPRLPDRPHVDRGSDIPQQDSPPAGRPALERPLVALERRELVTRGITGPPEVLSTSVICRRATVRWRPGAAPPWRSERRTVGSARPAAEDGGDVPAYRGHVDGNVPQLILRASAITWARNLALT